MEETEEEYYQAERSKALNGVISEIWTSANEMVSNTYEKATSGFSDIIKDMKTANKIIDSAELVSKNPGIAAGIMALTTISNDFDQKISEKFINSTSNMATGLEIGKLALNNPAAAAVIAVGGATLYVGGQIGQTEATRGQAGLVAAQWGITLPNDHPPEIVDVNKKIGELWEKAELAKFVYQKPWIALLAGASSVLMRSGTQNPDAKQGPATTPETMINQLPKQSDSAGTPEQITMSKLGELEKKDVSNQLEKQSELVAVVEKTNDQILENKTQALSTGLQVTEKYLGKEESTWEKMSERVATSNLSFLQQRNLALLSKNNLGTLPQQGNANNNANETSVSDTAWNKGLRASLAKFGSWAGDVSNVAATAAVSMRDTFASFFFDAMTGRIKTLGEYFSSFFKSVAQSISQLLANRLASSLIESLLGGLLGGGGTNPIAGINKDFGARNADLYLQPSFFFNKRAAGGPVSAGNLYLVGEEGPEAFVPGVSGTILPNNALTGNKSSGEVTVNLINNTGNQMQAKAQQSFDGARTVITLFLEGYSRNIGGIQRMMPMGAR